MKRADIKALRRGEGSVEVQVNETEGGTYYYLQRPSKTFAASLDDFVRACGRLFTRASRRYEVEGIDVEAQLELDDQDIEEIRALSADLGIHDVGRIFVGWRGVPSGTLQAIVEGRTMQDGETLLQKTLGLRHRYWDDNLRPSVVRYLSKGAVSRGLWYARPRNLGHRNRGIIHDDSWSIEVGFDPDIEYETAERIILAIRRGELIDTREESQRTHGLPGYPLRKLDRYSYPRIRFNDDGGYEVGLPETQFSGIILHVRIAGDHVELVSSASWIAWNSFVQRLREKSYRPNVVLISGLGGSGKTMVAEECADFEEGEYASARESFARAAARGYPFAQTQLGNMLSLGIGGTTDKCLACEWFEKAASVGEPVAQNNLGACFLNGGCELFSRDECEAQEWFTRAAEKQNSEALFNLAISLDKGYCQQRDPNAAEELFQRAARAGHVEAQKVLEQLGSSW